MLYEKGKVNMQTTGKSKISAIRRFLGLRKVKRWLKKGNTIENGVLYRNNGFMVKVDKHAEGCSFALHVKVRKEPGVYQWYYERYRYIPKEQNTSDPSVDYLLMVKSGVYPDWVSSSKK